MAKIYKALAAAAQPGGKLAGLARLPPVKQSVSLSLSPEVACSVVLEAVKATLLRCGWTAYDDSLLLGVTVFLHTAFPRMCCKRGLTALIMLCRSQLFDSTSRRGLRHYICEAGGPHAAAGLNHACSPTRCLTPWSLRLALMQCSFHPMQELHCMCSSRPPIFSTCRHGTVPARVIAACKEKQHAGRLHNAARVPGSARRPGADELGSERHCMLHPAPLLVRMP